MGNTYVITASVYVDDVASDKEAAESVEELNRGGDPGNITVRLPDEGSEYAWSFVGITGDPL